MVIKESKVVRCVPESRASSSVKINQLNSPRPTPYLTSPHPTTHLTPPLTSPHPTPHLTQPLPQHPGPSPLKPSCTPLHKHTTLTSCYLTHPTQNSTIQSTTYHNTVPPPCVRRVKNKGWEMRSGSITFTLSAHIPID